MAPVTALFGAPVSFALLVALNLAATAAALVPAAGPLLQAAPRGGRDRRRGLHRLRAGHDLAVATATCTSPRSGWCRRSSSCVIRLTRVTTTRGSTILTGLGLGVAVVAQVLLGEEVLFLTALTLGSVRRGLRGPPAGGWAPRSRRGSLAGLAVAARSSPCWCWPTRCGSSSPAPQHTPERAVRRRLLLRRPGQLSVVLAAVASPARPTPAALATSSAEFNTYLGLPLLLVVLGVLVWRWRAPLDRRAIAVTG